MLSPNILAKALADCSAKLTPRLIHKEPHTTLEGAQMIQASSYPKYILINQDSIR